jgi:thiol-disulfide isomerase/thioredoxin
MKKFLIVILSVLTFAACEKKQEKTQTVPDKAAGIYATLGIADYQKLLNDNKGRVILVNFFATWCPPCRKEISELTRLNVSYKDKGVVFIGISVDENGDEAVKMFAEKANFNYKVYLATPELSASQQIDAIPHSFFYDKKGKLVQSLKGYIEPGDITNILNMLI